MAKTVEEFIAEGGTVTVCEPAIVAPTGQISGESGIRLTAGGQPKTIGDEFYRIHSSGITPKYEPPIGFGKTFTIPIKEI